MYSVPLQALLLSNELGNPDFIYPGQVLEIPDATTASVLLTSMPTTTVTDPSDWPSSPTDIANNPLSPYSIRALSVRHYGGGEIFKEYQLATAGSYEQWSISYMSDGIRVTGLMNVPLGSGPYPVILLLHGGYDQSVYRQGDGTREHADYFAKHGYLTIAPDYRSYNDTDGSGTPLKIPWSIDVLNLIGALPSLPQAAANRVGIIGQSRGGGVASYVSVLTPEFPQVRAISLYSPLSFDQAANWERYAHYFGAEWPFLDAVNYGSPEANPVGYEIVSPINYLDRIDVPIQVHHGTEDEVLPVEWSRDLAAQLSEIGKEVEYFEYSGAGHTFYGTDYQLFLERSLDLFDTFVR